jgi:hypothetical protein
MCAGGEAQLTSPRCAAACKGWRGSGGEATTGDDESPRGNFRRERDALRRNRPESAQRRESLRFNGSKALNSQRELHQAVARFGSNPHCAREIVNLLVIFVRRQKQAHPAVKHEGWTSKPAFAPRSHSPLSFPLGPKCARILRCGGVVDGLCGCAAVEVMPPIIRFFVSNWHRELCVMLGNAPLWRSQVLYGNESTALRFKGSCSLRSVSDCMIRRPPRTQRAMQSMPDRDSTTWN